MRIIASIQYLRGLAASAVVVHHVAARYDLPIRGGAAGVDVFFVISGFIMWLIARRIEADTATFLKDRLIRVVPMYWLVTLALALAATLRPGLFPLDHPTATHIARSLLFLPHHAPHSDRLFPLVVQGWTLNYEMFFYGLFGLALLWPRSDRPWLITVILAGCVIAGAIFAPRGAALLVYTSPLLLEFLAGIWLASAWEGKSWVPAKFGWAALLAGFLLFAAVEVSGVQGDGPLRVLYWGLPAFLVVCGAVTLDRNGRLPRLPILQGLGNASYSIYLTHFLTITAVAIVADKLGFAPGPSTYMGTFAAALLAGVVCFAWIEKPLTRFVRDAARAAGSIKVPADLVDASGRHRIRPS
jgi:exopolysaccharide production protein ExoZ